jgi:hypothetical protein
MNDRSPAHCNYRMRSIGAKIQQRQYLFYRRSENAERQGADSSPPKGSVHHRWLKRVRERSDTPSALRS